MEMLLIKKNKYLQINYIPDSSVKERLNGFEGFAPI